MKVIIGLILFIPTLAIMLVGIVVLLISLFTIIAIIYNTISKNGKREKEDIG